MAESPTRRWFQFRLRTLLIGVVLIGAACGYVAHEMRIVAERKSWLESHMLPFFSGSHIYHPLANGKVEKAPGLVRRWMGDQPQEAIEVRREIPAKDLIEAEGLFPEASFFCDPLRP